MNKYIATIIVLAVITNVALAVDYTITVTLTTLQDNVLAYCADEAGMTKLAYAKLLVTNHLKQRYNGYCQSKLEGKTEAEKESFFGSP